LHRTSQIIIEPTQPTQTTQPTQHTPTPAYNDYGVAVIIQGVAKWTAHVGHIGVLDGQGGRGFGVVRDHRGPPRVHSGIRWWPMAVGRDPCMERDLLGRRGASYRRGNVAHHGAGHHASTAGLVLRYCVRRRVVRVCVRILRGRLARQSVGDLCVGGGRHVAPAFHGALFELSLIQLLGR